MPASYKTGKSYKPRKRRKQKKTLPAYLWLLAGLAIGLFIAFLVYLDKQPPGQTSFPDAVNTELSKLRHKHKKTSKKPARPVAETAKKEPRYNFYTLLQGMEVLIPESETRPPKTRNPATATPEKPARYILQVGSFQNLDDAEKLKARLAFLGVEANIQHVTVNKQQWHRVRSGPYADTRQLYRNQKILQHHHISALLMALKQ